MFQSPWPRTPSEKSLVELMEGSAAQMLCLLEALTDTNRRTLLTQPPAADNEVEILDVYAELFMAAQEIIAGNESLRNKKGDTDIVIFYFSTIVYSL